MTIYIFNLNLSSYSLFLKVPLDNGTNIYKNVFITRLHHEFTSTFILTVLKPTLLKRDFLKTKLLLGAFRSSVLRLGDFRR